MSSATLNRLLAILIGAQLVTGLLTLRAGSAPAAPLFVVHGLMGGALVAAVLIKLRRSLPRAVAAGRWGAIAVAGILAVAIAIALGGGFGWVASGRMVRIGPWTLLTVHVLAAVALVPIAVAHLLPLRWRVLRAGRRRAQSAAERNLSAGRRRTAS